MLGAFDHIGDSVEENDENYNAISETYGVTPALYNTYYSFSNGTFNYSTANSRIAEHYTSGAFCMVHTQNSWGKYLIDKYGVEQTDFLLNLDATNTDRNTDVYNEYLNYRKQWADALESLKTLGVTVIYRPFVEMTNPYHMDCYTNTEEGYAAFKRIWQQLYSYMVDERGLDNIVWCFAPQAAGGAEKGLKYYPGNDYVDIIGLTLYSTGNTNDSYNIQKELELWDYSDYYILGKPIGFSELGVQARYDSQTGEVTEPGDFSNLLYHLKNAFKGKISFCSLWSESQGLFGENNVNQEEFIKDEFFVSLEELLEYKA